MTMSALARVEVQVGEVVLVVVGLAQPGEDHVHAADPQHDLGLGVAVAVPDRVHDAGHGDRAGVPVVHLGAGRDGDGGADARARTAASTASGPGTEA